MRFRGSQQESWHPIRVNVTYVTCLLCGWLHQRKSIAYTIRCHWSYHSENPDDISGRHWYVYISYENGPNHYNDVIMTTMASQITSLTVVYSTVYSDADQRKHQSSASLAFVWWIHRDRWIHHSKGQLRGKCFHLMTSSCREYFVFI